MRNLLGLLSFCLAFQVLADTKVSTQIHDIELGSQMDEEALVFLTTGQVVKLATHELEMLDTLREVKRLRGWVELTIDDQRQVLEIGHLPSPEVPAQTKGSFKMRRQTNGYVPSTLGSMVYAKEYFKQMREGSLHDSQCYNRAHVWSNDWYKAKKFYSSKIFVFFTKRYIRKNNFDWWFHVAPYVHVIDNGKIVERVMDRKYANGPWTKQYWTNFFLKDDAPCPVVQKYSQYANYPESGSCFLMKAPMYYLQPLDFENEELYGTTKTFWIDWEVATAYAQAFGINEDGTPAPVPPVENTNEVGTTEEGTVVP